MQTWLSGVLMVGGGTLAAVLGLLAVRRLVPRDRLAENQEVAGFLIGVVGVFYAVLLGFVILVVWNNYEDVKARVTQEANQLGDMFHISEGLPDPVQSQLRVAMAAYGERAIAEEWGAMEHGERGRRTEQAVRSLWKVCLQIDPAAGRQAVLYDHLLSRMNQMTESRRMRLAGSHDKVPQLLWTLLWAGALLTVAFTYLFGPTSLVAQILMTAVLTAMITLELFLISVLQHPFRGSLRVPPSELQRVIGVIRSGSE